MKVARKKAIRSNRSIDSVRNEKDMGDRKRRGKKEGRKERKKEKEKFATK
jgi:hypothetical protein